MADSSILEMSGYEAYNSDRFSSSTSSSSYSSSSSSSSSTSSSSSSSSVSSISSTLNSTVNTVTTKTDEALSSVESFVSESSETASSVVSSAFESAWTTYANTLESVDIYLSDIDEELSSEDSSVSLLSLITNALNKLGTVGTLFSTIITTLANIVVYKDGVTETSFGGNQESSWKTMFDYLKSNSLVNTDTPLGSLNADAVYGNLILGTPPMYTRITDPANRGTLNSFVKDMRFLSLTPGLPKYNGGYLEQLIFNSNDTYMTQTTSVTSQIEYLRKNGFDTESYDKDKRYYTFQSKFDQYYAYLETMLNVVWIKLGLEDPNKDFDIFTFFGGNSYNSDLQSQYKSALGFYIQGMPSIAESLNNQSFDSGLAGDVNSASDEYQQLNYISGMGTANSTAQKVYKTAQRTAGGVIKTYSIFKDNVLNPLTLGVDKDASVLKKLLAVAKNVASYASTTDLSSVYQMFNTTNGMKVIYPNLWSNSSYSKSMSFEFDFVSPYGDPLSIFHYVYVPFFALLAFTLPRQCDENGYVSPFFVRADIAGQFTTDFALISDMTWTKGGSSGNLWTKDGLPRAIHVSITLEDLYPFLAMTKRISFMSANPSYTSFLDSMAGLHAIYDSSSDNDAMNQYFKDMLNRVTGNSDYASSNRKTGLANKYSSSVFATARKSGYTQSSAKSVSAKSSKGTYATPWFVNVK